MIWIILSVIVILLDQATKLIIDHHMRLSHSVPLIQNVFHITHVKNEGASWGVLSGGRWFFIILTVLVLVALFVWCVKKKPKHPLLCASLSLIAGGAVGNLIDRIATGKVTDFLDFCLIHFPVFNIADIAITCGTVLLCVYILIAPSADKKEKTEKSDE